ncbi:MAG: cold shock domain-containing protein [Chthoniobacterales bacterium]
MSRGIIKWFNTRKGFGFITDPRGEGTDIFVHHSEIRGEGFKSLAEGDMVEFELAPSERGPKALNVVRI